MRVSGRDDRYDHAMYLVERIVSLPNRLSTGVGVGNLLRLETWRDTENG